MKTKVRFISAYDVNSPQKTLCATHEIILLLTLMCSFPLQTWLRERATLLCYSTPSILFVI